MRILKRFAADRRGATAMEYGLICAAMMLALVFGASSLGGVVQNVFSDNSDSVSNAIK